LGDNLQCNEAKRHAKTHWLRRFIGPLHDKAAYYGEVSWDNLVNLLPFPQCGADMPKFIVALINRILTCRGLLFFILFNFDNNKIIMK
jgi:hypothetical protein